jgi:hypothetical protein
MTVDGRDQQTASPARVSRLFLSWRGRDVFRAPGTMLAREWGWGAEPHRTVANPRAQEHRF